MTQLPDGFTLHPRVRKIIDDRQKMARGKMRLDWGFCETAAYASLIRTGTGLRLVGQDSGRGTFFHRHAVLHNQVDGSVSHHWPRSTLSWMSLSLTPCYPKKLYSVLNMDMPPPRLKPWLSGRPVW